MLSQKLATGSYVDLAEIGVLIKSSLFVLQCIEHNEPTEINQGIYIREYTVFP